MPEALVRYIDLPYVDPQPLNDLLSRLRGSSYQETLQNITDNITTVTETMRLYVPAHASLMATAPHPEAEGWWNNCANQSYIGGCYDGITIMVEFMQYHAP